MNESTKTQRIIMTVVAVLGGIYLLAIAPTQAMQTLKICLDQVLLRLVPHDACLLYTSPSPRDRTRSRMPSSA